MRNNRIIGLFAAIAIGLFSATSGAGEIPAAIQAAVDNTERNETDRARDATRMPAKVLAFAGIEAGMTVLDIFSGGGYYTEMLSSIVGPDGGVIAHYNQSYLKFSGEEMDARYKDDRFSNVRLYMAEANDLDVGKGTADAAMFILGYHDIFYVDEDPDGWPAIDEAKFVANIYRALKPGGVLIVIDHTAPEGAGRESGTSLHRIRPEIVKAGLEAAGFTLEAEADFLRNPEDPLNISPFEANIRGDTDRFVQRYRKPSM